MGIKSKCESCGSQDIHIDLEKKGIWCNGCGELDQISVRSYDWEETEE